MRTRAPTPFTRYELKAVALPPHHDGLQKSLRPDTIGKLTDALIVHFTPCLVGVRFD